MAMLPDEISLLKSVMVEVEPGTALLVTMQYHTEPNSLGKTDRSKSKYRWMARVFKIEDLKKKIDWLYEDANRLNRFKWPNDPWPYFICANDSENGRIADWLSVKLKKLRSWEDGQKILKGWETQTAKRAAGYNLAAKYETEDYLDESGNKVSLTDKDALLARVGQNLWKLHNVKTTVAAK